MGKNTRIILIGGLIIIPFFEGIIYLLTPYSNVLTKFDLRETKEYLAIGFALALTTSIWLENKQISCPNKWALFFLTFLFLNMSKTPIAVANPVVDLSLLGNYSAEFKVFAFFLMFCSLASCRFSKKFIGKIFLTIFISAVVMSAYMVLQACNLDQIYNPKPEYFNTGVKSIRVAGFLGQPTLAVPFIAMAIPFAVYFKKIWGVVILSVAALLTGSDFAFLCLSFLLVAYSWRIKKVFFPLVGTFIIAIIGLVIRQPYGFFNNNGRFQVWSLILKDVFTGEINGVPVRIGLTGAGLDNFGRIFTALHSSPYTRAHNEPLQVLWTCGVIGLGIFLMIHFDVFKEAWKKRNNPLTIPLILSLSVLMLCSLGTFVYQLGIYQYFVVVLIGLVYQISSRNKERKLCLKKN